MISVNFSNEEMLSIKDDILTPLSEDDILTLVENHNSSNLKAKDRAYINMEQWEVGG